MNRNHGDQHWPVMDILMGQPKWEHFCSCGADGGAQLSLVGVVMQMSLCWSMKGYFQHQKLLCGQCSRVEMVGKVLLLLCCSADPTTHKQQETLERKNMALWGRLLHTVYLRLSRQPFNPWQL